MPPHGPQRESWKKIHENLFVLRDDWYRALTDGRNRRMVFWPCRAHLLEAISLVEKALVAEERKIQAAADTGQAPASWLFDIAKVFADGASRTLAQDTGESFVPKMPMYLYTPLWFDEMDDGQGRANASILDYWSNGKGRMMYCYPATDSKALPVTFQPPLPQAFLPLPLPLVLLVSTAQLRQISERLPTSRWKPRFREEVAWADYLLSLLETETPSSWRARRPESLPFPAPPANPTEAVSSAIRRQYTEIAVPAPAAPMLDGGEDGQGRGGSHGSASGSEDDYYLTLEELNVEWAQSEVPVRRHFGELVHARGPAAALNWLRASPHVANLADLGVIPEQDPPAVQRSLVRMGEACQCVEEAEEEEHRDSVKTFCASYFAPRGCSCTDKCLSPN